MLCFYKILIIFFVCIGIISTQDLNLIDQKINEPADSKNEVNLNNENQDYYNIDEQFILKITPNVTIEFRGVDENDNSETWNLHLNNGDILPENDNIYSRINSSPKNMAKNIPDIRATMLNCINQIRSVEGEKAANMNMLVWDYTIEGYATNSGQKICSSGLVGQSPNNWPYKGAEGELIATSPKLNNAESTTILDKICDLVQQWNNTSSFLSKKADFSDMFKWEIGNSFKYAEPYLQLVLAKATSIGCSFHTNCHKDIGTVIVCQFSDKPDPRVPPYAHIYNSQNLTEPQRQPCGRCGFGAKCCYQNLCIGRDIGSFCEKCSFSEPIKVNNDDIALCLDKYYQPCSKINCPEACISKHQVTESILINQCICTSKQLIEDMLLFDQLPSDPQMSYTEGWKRKKYYSHGICKNINGELPKKVDIPDVGSNYKEPNIEEENIGIKIISSESIRTAIVNNLNTIRSSQPAADMAMLIYDFTLEGYSRIRAKQICEIDNHLMEFSGINGTFPPFVKWPYRGGSGETIFVFNETVSIPEDIDNQDLANIQLGTVDPMEVIEEAIQNWYLEGEDFDFHNLTNNVGKSFYNYRMIVRAEATAVGCSMATNCRSKEIKTIFVCQYNYPNYKEPMHVKESISRRKLLDVKYLEFDLPFLHIEADPFLLLQQRRPCGRCRRGSTCCENNLCVGIDISQSSITFVPPIIENRSSGGCRSAFVRPCNQLNCQVNCMNPSSSYLSHQCFCVSPDNMNKLAFADPEALELNSTLIEEILDRNITNERNRMLIIDGVSTPYPIATYGYIFGLINSHGLCLKLPDYQNEYGDNIIDSIEANMTSKIERMEFSVDTDNVTLLSDIFVDLPEDDLFVQKDLTDKFRQEFLLAINSFRSIAGEFATNMNKLAYDFTLEGIAKSSAKQCQIASLNRQFEIKGVPPLTYLSPANETLLPNNVASIVASWGRPLVSTSGNIDKESFIDNLSKFSKSLPKSARQLFSAHATSVGCSIFSNCPEGRYFVVCQFNHLDNRLYPFIPTEDGVSIPKIPCSCCGSQATCCENNLCVGGNSVGQDFSVCKDVSSEKSKENESCSSSFYKNCKDINCQGQCLKPLEETDPFFEHYIFNQCTCSKKNIGSSPQAGLLQDGKALIRGICTSVNTTRLDYTSILIKHENLLDIELISNGRNGNTVSQALSSALQTELKGKLSVLDSRPLLYALNKERSRIGKKAVNMNMLKWEYSLQGYAQNWAMVCLAGKNNHSPQEFPYRGGESEVVYSSEIDEEYDEFISPIKITKTWFSAEEIYERNNGNVPITPRVLDFLTVSQASSSSVGCAVVKGCPNAGFVVVCQFDSGVHLNKYPYIKIDENDSSLSVSQAHPCGKCSSGSTCCNENLCVGINQNPSKLAAPLVTKLSSNKNCINSIVKKCNSGFCPESCIPQITLEESEKIPLYNEDNSIQFTVNQCQCVSKDFIGTPIETWKVGLVRRNGQCEKVKGYDIDVVKTQTHYIKVVTALNNTLIQDKIKNPEDDLNHQNNPINHGLSKECIEKAKYNSLLPRCIADPINCGAQTTCYAYPERNNCYCTNENSEQCQILKLCRRDLPNILNTIKPNCAGKHILSEDCPCSKNIFSLECSCSVYPKNPGCPCDKEPESLICEDLLRTSEAAQKRINIALTEISRVTKTLRG